MTEKIIKNILEKNKRVSIYFENLSCAEKFLKWAKKNGFSVPDVGCASLALIYENKHIEYISYGNHEKISDKEIIRIKDF